MFKKYFLVLPLFIIGFSFTDSATAYDFVEAKTIKLSDTTFLFTHTYTAGFLNEDVTTPIVTSTDKSTIGGADAVNFSILSSQAKLTGATVSALVLSTATIADNRYSLQEGIKETFTLMALVTLSTVFDATDLTLKVNTVPYTYERAGETRAIIYSAK